MTRKLSEFRIREQLDALAEVAEAESDLQGAHISMEMVTKHGLILDSNLVVPFMEVLGELMARNKPANPKAVLEKMKERGLI